MNCPVCNHSLEPVKYEYLPYQYCRWCQGMWVEAKLLKNLAVRMAVDSNIKPKETIPFKPRTVERPAKDNRIRLCPKCSAGMKQLNYAYDSNVIVDRCDACEGIWLDQGEMMRLAQFHQVDENSIIAGRALMDMHNLPDKMEKQFENITNVLMALMWFGI